MSDDRLFASNNAIGRKWYYINIIILGVLTFFSGTIFQNIIIPQARTQMFTYVTTGIMYFLYFIFFISFFSLIDRRLYDIFGSRDKEGYKFTLSIFNFIIFGNIVILFCLWKNISLPVSSGDLILIIKTFDIILLVMVILIGFFKGNFSIKKYRRKY